MKAEQDGNDDDEEEEEKRKSRIGGDEQIEYNSWQRRLSNIKHKFNQNREHFQEVERKRG